MKQELEDHGLEADRQPKYPYYAQGRRQGISTPPPKSSKLIKRLVLGILILVIAGLAIFGILWLINGRNSSESTNSRNSSTNNQSPEDGTIRFTATGDVIAHDSINAEAKQPNGKYDYSGMFGSFGELFAKSDINFCNQATLAGGEQYGISGYPVFNAPTQLSYDMSDLGCNLVNIGTNHTYDKDQSAISSAVSTWENIKPLAFAGANKNQQQHDEVKYFEIKGVKFAFLSYSTYTNIPKRNDYGLTIYDKELAKQQMSEANQNADLVIVSMRWGTEYSDKVNTDQRLQANQLADYGADMVLGHGSHVLQPVETIEGNGGNTTVVWYSLGNFLNAQLEKEALFNGMAVIDIDIKSKEIKNLRSLPVYMHYEWTPDQKKNEDLLSRKNHKLYTFDEATDELVASQHDTTLAEQLSRIDRVLNAKQKIKLITRQDYLQR